MFLRGRPVTMYMPKEQVDSYSLEAKVELPAKRLKLEWVYPSASQCLTASRVHYVKDLFPLFQGDKEGRMEREGEGEISQLLVHSPEGHDSPDWASGRQQHRIPSGAFTCMARTQALEPSSVDFTGPLAGS